MLDNTSKTEIAVVVGVAAVCTLAVEHGGSWLYRFISKKKDSAPAAAPVAIQSQESQAG